MDDEETIAKAEKQDKDVGQEVSLLNEECNMSLTELLDNLPPGYLNDVFGSGMF